MPDDVDLPDPDDVLTPDAVASRVFHTAFRGFDPVEVRAFLAQVAEALRAAEEAAAAAAASTPSEGPAGEHGAGTAVADTVAPADPNAVVAAAVAEAEEVLRDARRRGRALEEEAVAEGRRIVEAARTEAQSLLDRARNEAEAELRSAKSKARAEVGREATRLRAEAEQAAAEARVDAERQVAKLKQQAEQEAAAIVEGARERGREMVVEAQAARERMLTDLARRKRAAQAQIEQLRATRDRLLEALKSARRSVDEVTLRFDGGDDSESANRRERVRPAAEAGPGAEPGPPPPVRSPGGPDPSSESGPSVGTGAAGGPGEGEPARPALPSLPEHPEPSSEGVRIIGTRPSIDAPRAAQAASSLDPDGAGAGPGGHASPDRDNRGREPRRSERRSSALRILRRARTADDEAEVGQETEAGHDADTGHRPPRGRGGEEHPAPEPATPPAPPGEGVRVLAPTAGEVEEAGRADDGASPEPVDGGVGGDPAVVEPAGEVTVGDAVVVAEAGGPAGEAADDPAGEAPGQEAGDEHDHVEGVGDVDDIFARLRAEREAATAAARRVLEADQDAPAPRPPAPGDGGVPAQDASAGDGRADAEEGAPATDAASEAVGVAVSGAQAEGGLSQGTVTDADEERLQARDQALAELEEGLTRRLKRNLQDEQNAALDRLRTHRGRIEAHDLLGSVEDQAGPYLEAAKAHLDAAARAGAASSPMGAASVVVDDLAAQLAGDIAASLRQRLELALQQAAAEDLEATGIAERVNAAYREWKTQRIGHLTVHYTNAAFNRGLFLATPEGTPMRWLVDDEAPCPDCDDNALSGATPRGEAFPTGQLLPPAHVGCRCLLIRAVT